MGNRDSPPATESEDFSPSLGRDTFDNHGGCSPRGGSSEPPHIGSPTRSRTQLNAPNSSAPDEDPENQIFPPPRHDEEPPDPGIPPDPPPTQDEERSSNTQTFPPDFTSPIDDIRIAQKFIECLRTASLDNDDEPLPADLLEQLRNPPQTPLTLDNPDHRLSLDIFLSVSNASEETYNSVRLGILRRHPDDDILTYHRVKKLVTELSGITSILHDMCTNSCIGYTGPFAQLEGCLLCGEPRYDPKRAGKIPRKQFHTIPIGPQLQALWRTPQGAHDMRYRARCTEAILEELRREKGKRTSPYRDFFDGLDYIDAVREGKINLDDMLLVFSIDGAQLYRNKSSDCWIYIWVILDLPPELRYKKRHILPGGFIPGPQKPKNTDSFIYSGLHHVAALQREGLRIWDAASLRIFTSRLFLALGSADGPGMAALNGCVGHHGKYSCRLYCPLVGRHKPGGTHYYPARFLPGSFAVAGCDHPDVDLNTLLKSFTSKEATARYDKNLLYVSQSRNKTQYEKRRLETGICKPTIFSGIHSDRILGVPGLFSLDIMHLPALNLPDLFIPLWRGTFDCDPTDNVANWPWAVLRDVRVWKEHGKLVAQTTPYIPGSFDRPPRNPAEKISSGYKAWEFLLYFFGLGPALFYNLLPDEYWMHYCKLVRGIRILTQEEILREEVALAHRLLTEFSDDFERLYVQRRVDRIHFVRPSIHTTSHLAPETIRVGPGIIYSQWGMERTIGNLGEEIKQHSNAFANLAQRGIRRCQVNALKAMIPDLELAENPLPRGSRDLGEGYAFLCAMDTTSRPVRACEERAIIAYLQSQGGVLTGSSNVIRWSRLRLPNGQIARSEWKESLKPLEDSRMSRNVKLEFSGTSYLAEVLFFMMLRLKPDVPPKAVAMVSLYGPPHPGLFTASSNTYWTVQHLRDAGVRVVDAKNIKSAVMLAPDERYKTRFRDGTEVDRWYLMEKPGLKLSERVGLEELLVDPSEE